MPKFESHEEELEFLDSLQTMKTREFKKAVSQYLKENANQRKETTQQMANLWAVVLNFQKQFKMFAESINRFMNAIADKLTPRQRRKLDS